MATVRNVRKPRTKKETKYYPLEPHTEKFYPIDQNFTNYNNVSYYGDQISKYEKRYTNLSDENIILNLNQFNPINNLVPIDMGYSDTREQPILPYKADAYALCVSSVYIPSTSIYLFEWVDKVVANNGVEYDKYGIQIEINNIPGLPDGVYSWPLKFVPYIQTDSTGPVKRVFEINQCIVSLNNAFKELWDSLGVSTLTDYNTVCYPPSFQLDTESSLIYVIADQRINPPSLPGGLVPNPAFIKSSITDYVVGAGESWLVIGFNYWVHQWFQSSFPCTIVSTDPSNPVACYLNIYNDFSKSRFITYPYGDANAPYPSAYDPDITFRIFYQLYQFNSTTELFSTIQKILVQSSLQVRPSYTTITAQGSYANINPDSMQFINTLIDFYHTASSFNNNEVSGPIEYIPPWHMWLDILTQDQIKNISFQVFVQRTDGVLNKLQLMPGEMCNIKLLFRLK